MLPSKLKALNDCSSDESSENEEAPIKITKEALETKAELQYSQALQFLARDKLDKAEEQLFKLLQSDIISSVNTTLNQKDKSQSLLAHLKYCCLTNLGNLLLKKFNYHEALIHYQEALKMDNTDLNLWYRIGLAHSKLYQTDQAISAFLEGIKCNPNHWPTLDKLITLLYASNEYVCCLYHISLSLNLDSGYLKGHFIKEMIYKKFPSLIPYFKSYCLDGGLDIKCTELIEEDIKKRVLIEIEDIKTNDPTLCLRKISSNIECKPVLYAKPLTLKNWHHLGKWLLKIYDYMFENYEHSLLYEPIEFSNKSSEMDNLTHHIIVDKNCSEDDFEKQPFKIDVPPTKRRKSSPSLADQLKLSRRSARNKANTKVNESTLVKSVWDVMPQYLLFNKDGNNKLNINSIKWSDDSMDTMDLYRLYEFSDMLSDGHTENLLKNNTSHLERIKQIKKADYFGSDQEAKDLTNFIEVNANKSISDLLENYLNAIANKWSSIWPTDLVQVYIDVFKKVWIHTEKQHIIYISEPNFNSLDNEQVDRVKNEITAILTYGELLCDLYFQFKINHKPLEGSIFGGEFCSLWMGGIDDALSTLDLEDDYKVINIRFQWLRALFNLQDKEIGLTCDVLDVLLNFIDGLDDYEIILPNSEYFYRINKKIVEKLIITLNRNNLLSTVKELYESKKYLNVVDILKETLKPQSRTFMEIPNYQAMKRFNQYIFMLNSLLELKNYYELFKWCESCLYEAILQHRKSLIEDCDSNQRTNHAEFINNIFYAMLESIKIEGSKVFNSLSQGYKSRLIQSIINLLSYLIETADGNPEIDSVSPWLLIYNLLKHEESQNEESFSSLTTSIPQSLSLLILGHEYLGKRSWCCFEDGVLLFLTLSEIEQYIHSDLYTDSLVQHVDQIFYCLFTHLIKRNRPRHVQDHHSMGLALTWPRARQLVHFYQPLELPSYDGLSKSFTVNSDTEAMLKKVIFLIPSDIKPNRLMDDLIAYIKGDTDQLPKNNNPLPNDVKDIYYLLADYNFKNKTWNKAIRYYLLDLCNNLDRFDSWAAMALARGSQIETKLNSCESIKNEGEIIRSAHMAGRCYKHSLKISPENTTLLIEYGTFTYSIHSFCSRLLKQETSNMSLQMFGELEEEKEKMMKIARKCFETANNVWNYTDCDSQDERWMHYYILGKIAENNDENPTLCMDHYIKAAQFLDSYGAEFPENILYTAPQYYSIEVLEIYYRIHASALKLLEKYDNQILNNELYMKIEAVLDRISNMSPIISKNKKNKRPNVDIMNSNDKVKKENIELIVKQTLDDIINHVVNTERGPDSLKLVISKKWCYQTDNMYSKINENKFNTVTASNNSNITVTKNIKLVNNSTAQNTTNLRWTLIQRCLSALEDCIKRFPQHYKSYYRLAQFYFRSSSHKDHKKFKDLMFGEKGLFAGQRPNNFFHGVWRIPVSEIDRPGSFAYHMSRCIHLLLDFLKETGDHQMLLDLAIQLKCEPDLEKKYLRDNEREDISKEALFLSIQILRKLKSENAKCTNRSKNELLLIQVYKSYKRVFKCWQQKDNTLSKLLLNVYQNIIGTKDDVSIDIIIKYCQKLQLKEKEIEYQSTIENNDSAHFLPSTSPKTIQKLDVPLSSATPVIPTENQNRPYSQQITPSTLPMNAQDMSNQLLSFLAPYTQSPLMFALPSGMCSSYAYTLQQKLQATKQKLKRNNNKQKSDSKRSLSNKTDKSETNRLSNDRPKKNASKKNSGSKSMSSSKSSFVKSEVIGPQLTSKLTNVPSSKFNEPKLTHTLEPLVNINRLSSNFASNKFGDGAITAIAPQKPKHNKTNIEKSKTSTIKHKTAVAMSKTKPATVTSRNSKSVYIDLDSAAEQARLKSSIIHTKVPEKKKASSVPLNPAMLLSSCPGLSITPVVNANDKSQKTIDMPSSSMIRNNQTKSKNFNFEHLQQLGNSITITKADKSGNKTSKPEVILID